MKMIFCPNCGKLTGYKRALGFGTFFAVLLTAGLWLLAIPFYPKRCITCGLGKSESVPWHQTWRLAAVLLVGGVLVTILFEWFSSGSARHTADRTNDLAEDKTVVSQNSSDLYSPERVAEYCRTHPTGFYGAVGSKSGVSCPDRARQNQSKSVVAVQNSRDDWRQVRTSADFDLDAHLPYTLANAPFRSGERSQILRVIEKFASDDKEKVDPETLMGARVGSIGLAEDGSQQILVQGPYAAFCGASGNCPMWIFTVDRSGQFRLALEMSGNAVILRNTSSHGFRDFATSSHMSAYEQYLSVYRWNGTKYDQVDCYTATVDSDRSSPTVIADCQK
jgi:hypothetical protein